LVGVPRRALPSLDVVGTALAVKTLVAASNSNAVVAGQVPTLLARAGLAGVHLLGVPLVELAPALRQLSKSSTEVWGREADHISYNSVPVSRTEGLSQVAMSQSTLAPPKDVHENTVTEVISLGLYTPRHYGF
jgi:hypothetical protein